MWVRLTFGTSPETGDFLAFNSQVVKVPEGTKLRVRFNGIEETCEVYTMYHTPGRGSQDIPEIPYVYIANQARKLSDVDVWTYTFKDFQDDFDKGTFDDIKDTWNWCIDVQKDVCTVYVMGTGAEQCHYRWPANPGVTADQLESYIKQRFHVDRVLHGVG